MHLLAFDTSTERLSIALSSTRAGETRLWQHEGPGGAQASSTLIPALNRLLEEAQLRYEQLDAIAFGQGPGSFTGLRTACSVAQGLGLGAGIPLLPVDTLLAVAEEARYAQAPQADELDVLALLDARMDEVYAARYRYTQGQWRRQGDYRLGRPEDLQTDGATAAAGNVFAVYAERLQLPPALPRWPAWPTASAMLRLAPALLAAGAAVPAAQALPLYIRDKVAKTTAEREAEKLHR